MDTKSIERLLKQRATTKEQLREALYHALGQPHNYTPFQQLSVEDRVGHSAKSIYIDFYRQLTGVDYNWHNRDLKHLKDVLAKINGLYREPLTEATLLDKFESFLQNLPPFYRESNCLPRTLDSSFNAIVQGMRRSKKQAKVSVDYVQNIAHNLVHL